MFWVLALLVVAGISISLFVAPFIGEIMQNQDFQAVLFLSGMILVGVAIVVKGFKFKPGGFDLAAGLGVVAVYLMVFLRLGLAERSHLIEYSVLALFIFSALEERKQNARHIPFAWLITFIVAFSIGILDEVVQIFLPDRVFDWEDIVFNGSAIAFAIGLILAVRWFRKLFNRPDKN